MFEIKSVSKKFGDDYALKDITMNIGKGMNFIVGSSGSGKTTLLKIISGMEEEFKGEVIFNGKSIKKLKANEKALYYNQVLGFIWQDFNLIENRTVEENILLPNYLSDKSGYDDMKRILRELKINNIAKQKVSSLSGGQKQRVAIARELMKNPQVIIADEPTSALDEASSKSTMEILKTLAKKRTVIVVTHDTSLIDTSSKVYEIDKGELVSSCNDVENENIKNKGKLTSKLSFSKGLKLGLVSLKSSIMQNIVMALIILISSTMLLVSFSGSIKDSGQSQFNKLLETYGENLLDINLASSFTGAGGTDGGNSDSPNKDVSQSLDGLFDKYKNDKRVAHVLFSQSFDNISITVDGQVYNVDSSGSIPVMNKVVAGNLPNGSGNEVVVPESFVKNLGISNEDIIGKEIIFNATIFNWESGSPVEVKVETKAKVTGVIDTNMAIESQGSVIEFSVDDSFFFSQAALREIKSKASMKKIDGNIDIRAKSPEDLISLKDELNSKGIVPLGRFELVEDIVRLNNNANVQTSLATNVIGVIAVLTTLVVAFISSLIRRREYAILKVSGFSNTQVTAAIFSEFFLIGIMSSALFVALSPLINSVTIKLWNMPILSLRVLTIGVIISFVMSIFAGAVTSIIGIKTSIINALKVGDR
ncbi:MAG: ABC transporter ATP-binding protein/permease [Clostridium sp.]